MVCPGAAGSAVSSIPGLRRNSRSFVSTITLGSGSSERACAIASPRPDHCATVAVVQNKLTATTTSTRAGDTRRTAESAGGAVQAAQDAEAVDHQHAAGRDEQGSDHQPR